jgi:DNA recombination protein Rad52
MSFTDTQIKELTAPLNSKHVKQRSQAGRSLSYIEGWHAIAEANRIFGHAAWSREIKSLVQCGEPREIDGKYRVAFYATVRVQVWVDNGPITREGTGYGSGIDRDLGSAYESAVKEAETDAMKRALMTFGNPFGLALYDKDQTNVIDADEAEKAKATELRIEQGVTKLITRIVACKTVADMEALTSEPAVVKQREYLRANSPAHEQQIMTAIDAALTLINGKEAA